VWFDCAVDGVHDLGGMQGFGPVVVEPDEPAFHARWEGRVFASAGGALGAGGFNTPMFRHSIERMQPAHYLSSGYYEHWLTGVTTLLVERGLLTLDELTAATGSNFPLSGPVLVDSHDVDTTPASTTARFAVGDAVRVRDVQFAGHTRCPGYVRGRQGVVVGLEVRAPVPELEAHLQQKVDEQTYAVRFAARELWGDTAEPNNVVHVDLYDRYLEPV
jgi:nitrile hydratase